MNKTDKYSALRWISNVAGEKKIYIVILMFVHIIQAICSVGMAVILKRVVDEAVAKDVIGFEKNLAFFVINIFVWIVMSALAKYLDEYTLSTLENRFKSKLFCELLKKDYATVTARHSGEWMNRMTSDTVVVADGLTHIIPGVVGMVVKLLGALALIIIYFPAIAYIILPGGVILLIITYVIRKVMKKMHKSVQEADGCMRIFIQENLSSMLIVRTFAREDNAIAGADVKMNEHKNARMKRNRFSNFCNICFAVVMNGVYVFGIGYCCYGILSGKLSYGTLMAMMQLVGQLQSPLANITGFLPKYYAMLASGERLMEVDEYENEIINIKSLSEITEFYSNEIKTIEMSNAGFSYKNKDDDGIMLADINIQIKKGEFVALTGPSGCGKSTLLKLFMCIYPLDEGERYLHTACGKIKLDSSFKRLFAYVPQGNHLMSGTIREVVSFFDEKLMEDDEKINEALRISCADGFVSDLKDGLDSVLGERGYGLSEGQMQRLAIARAVLADCPILLLDEATSALDECTEKIVLENIRKMTDKTVLIVTHRPAALEICDKKIEL